MLLQILTLVKTGLYVISKLPRTRAKKPGANEGVGLANQPAHTRPVHRGFLG